jgi:hypothetical protein
MTTAYGRATAISAVAVMVQVMAREGIQTASDELRKLAGWIVRDGVSSDQLEAYMRGLLNHQLIELSACCRNEAMLLARCFASMRPAEIARHLSDLAGDLEKASAKPVEPVRPGAATLGSSFEQNSAADTGRESRPAGQVRRRRLSWLPEMVAALSCTVIGAVLLQPNYGDSALRVTAASGCGILSMVYASEAVRTVWRNRHVAAPRDA